MWCFSELFIIQKTEGKFFRKQILSKVRGVLVDGW